MGSITLPTGLLTLPLSDDLALLHIRALLWTAEHRTDGALPVAALDVLTRRADAGELALRLVAAGVWTQTATGWTVVDSHRQRVSAARAEAGRRGGQRSGEVRAAKQTKQPLPVASEASSVASPGDPRTVPARASGNPEGSEGSEGTTTPTPPARKVAAAPVAPDPEGERLLAVMREAAGEALDLSTSSPAMRADLSRRLAALRVGDAVVARMGALCVTPRKAWPWAKALGSGTVPDPVSVAWLLGGKRDDGARTGRPLRDLAWKAEADVRAQRAAEEARRQALAEREAERARRASQPPMTGAMLREIRERMSLRAPVQAVA